MKLLLVEDDTFFREFYSTKLLEKKFDVQVAENGEIGLQLVQSFHPDIVLLDIIMPKMDGFEVLNQMGKLGLINKIPVLVFSTLGQEKDVEKARLLGARGYINKSFFDFEKLYSRILELLPK